MDVILLEKIENLGALGDRVSIKSGYARNFLIPQKKAIFATPDNIKEFETRRSELEMQAADALTAARSRAERLEGQRITILAKAGSEGKLFGSIGTADIVEAVSSQYIEIAKREVRLPAGNIRQTGEFEINLHLHSDVDVTIQLAVVPE